MNSNSQKVAIVGAGVVGLYLAWKLSKAGHKVIVFGKNQKVGQKPCSGLISERIKNFIPWQDNFAENKIETSLLHFSGKTITLKFKPVHWAINRQKLDEYLYNLAREAGAEISLNHPITEIPRGFDRVIGCDGAFSKIRELLVLPQPSFRLGLQIFQEKEDYSNSAEVWFTPRRFFKKNGGGQGFFWKIPRGHQIEYGALGGMHSIKQNFKKFLNDRESVFLIKGQGEIKAALIPQGLILPKSKPHSRETSLRGENITLCGDAAGLTKPWSGGGVIWGLTAANILLKYFPDFEKYHKEVKKFFNPKILKGKLATNLVYFLGHNFPRVLPSKITRDNDFPVL